MARRPSSAPATVADLMPQILRRLGGDARVAEGVVFDAYQQVAARVLPAPSEPERLRDGTLWIRVGGSALAHEVAMRKTELIELLRARLGPEGPAIVDLRTRVGPLAGTGSGRSRG